MSFLELLVAVASEEMKKKIMAFIKKIAHLIKSL